MKLILTREVPGLGLAGDIVEVADGYGRNFLVPRGAAINWTKGAEKQISQIKRAQDARGVRGLDHANELKARPEPFLRYMRAYRDTLDWIYSTPEGFKASCDPSKAKADDEVTYKP